VFAFVGRLIKCRVNLLLFEVSNEIGVTCLVWS